ncbi:MAG: sensor histidine kinase, partial [Gammaproteobacteria bacterium]
MKPGVFYLLLALPLAVLAATQIFVFQKTPLTGEWLYPLLVANVVLIAALLCLIAVTAFNFWRRWRRSGPGTRLASRLAGLFLGIAILPSAMLYAVSAGGVFRGIESWFDTPLTHAFQEGMAFGQHVLGQEFSRLERDALNLAQAVENGSSLPFWRDDLRLFYQVDGIIIYGADGNPTASATDEAPPSLSAPALESLRRNRAYRNISGAARRNLEVAIPLPHRRAGFALQVSRTLPEGIDSGLAEVERGKAAYENLLILRRGLLYSFMATLTLSFTIVLAASLWASVRLGARLFRPLTKMAQAASAVGRGDFSFRLADKGGDDEIAQLGRAFNTMVGDLQQTRRQIGERQAALFETNVYLEKLLGSLASGVLAADAEGRLARFNGVAETMLETPLAGLTGKHFSEWGMPQIAPLVEGMMSGGGNNEERRIAGKDGRMLVARLRRLPLAGGGGVLVMVDDISRQMAEEREIVWEEASRRFAHEIKNPLTPIQLAADRLKSKLSGKLSGEDLELLLRMSRTVDREVEAMREMVKTFQLYAGGQSRRRTSVNLNALAGEVARSYERPPFVLEVRRDETLPPVQADEVLVRQALHNILLNAAEAASGAPHPRIRVSVEQREGRAAVVVEDNGGGVADFIKDEVFTPYQTSKEKGTGLGLAIVRKIMEEHGGEAYLENRNGGACATLLFPLPKDEK